MTFRVGLLCAACALALALLVPGCKKAKVRSDSSEEGPRNNPISDVRNQGAGPGVGAVLPSVGRAVTLNELKDFALAYHEQMSADGRPPANLDVMKDFIRNSSKTAQSIRDGDVIVYWGADPRTATAGSSNTVLAYVKDAPVKGGVVALLDGSARNVPTKQEFDQLAKPGK